jgi:DNA-binding NtrC family response regulator
MHKHAILFVDDEPNVTAALKRACWREPYEVLSAGSAKEALGILAQREVDVVVSDERMPEMSGSEFLAQVRKRHPHTIRIILTGQATLDAAIRAINSGEVYRFFTKPCNEVDLKITLRQALQQRELAAQSRRLLREYRRKSSVLEEIERENPGITRVCTDGSGAILLEEVKGDMDELLEQIAQATGTAAAQTTAARPMK